MLHMCKVVSYKVCIKQLLFAFLDCKCQLYPVKALNSTCQLGLDTLCHWQLLLDSQTHKTIRHTRLSDAHSPCKLLAGSPELSACSYNSPMKHPWRKSTASWEPQHYYTYYIIKCNMVSARFSIWFVIYG